MTQMGGVETTTPTRPQSRAPRLTVSQARPPAPRRRRRRWDKDRLTLGQSLLIIFLFIGVPFLLAGAQQSPFIASHVRNWFSSPQPGVNAPPQVFPNQFPPSAGVPSPATPSSEKVLAVGTSLPGGGRAPSLVAMTSSSGIDLHSKSSMPVEHQGEQRLRRFAAALAVLEPRPERDAEHHHRPFLRLLLLAGGQAWLRSVTRRGTMVLHEDMNGVRMPDGAATSTTVVFAR